MNKSGSNECMFLLFLNFLQASGIYHGIHDSTDTRKKSIWEGNLGRKFSRENLPVSSFFPLCFYLLSIFPFPRRQLWGIFPIPHPCTPRLWFKFENLNYLQDLRKWFIKVFSIWLQRNYNNQPKSWRQNPDNNT